ncbi:xanthine/uracil permease family protein [Parvularcula bermudensis HTCC2503]|uniref:Xanthine/uracil permease family protein n=1 Tax=Parvularcula bermudensis (strain ATCC BAA-594 / HTCC2503 / KCTC 12087) TaxID=314260 RepID=E0TCY0_PARBH|nr:nucleobase:cation symporter-2 family protein [Parvularcula bermudensis]ADM10363.1 xanthine/uracil permease family protein [Parvularcula bermudensis HTCC2503]
MSGSYRDPDYFPPLGVSILLGVQHILAMFVSNVTPAVIVAGAAGIGFGAADQTPLIVMIQASMVFAGVATLLQTISLGPIGARLPIVQGTSFAFLPIMIPLVSGGGVSSLSALYGGALCGGIFHLLLAPLVPRIRFALPPLVTGLVVLMIGLSLIRVGIQYSAGGVPSQGTAAFGRGESWALALVVMMATLGFKFFGRGLLSTASVLLGILTGYAVAAVFGRIDTVAVSDAAWFLLPEPLPFGVSFSAAAIVSFCLIVLVSGIETIGDVSAITQSGAGRRATDRELTGATFADGAGTLIAALFGGLPNSSFSQNVGLVAMTGVMSRHVVTLGAVFLVLCGLVPKIGAAIVTIPIEVLGGSVVIMFGMVAAAGLSMLSEVTWSQRNLLIFATSLSVGLGLQLVPDALQHLPSLAQILLASGVLPAAFLAIVMSLALPPLEDKE